MIPIFNTKAIKNNIKKERELRALILKLARSKNKTSVPKNVFYFYGGVGGMKGLSRGLIHAGKPIGVTVGHINKDIMGYINKDKPFTFVDSGAYGEFTSGKDMSPAEFSSRYDQLPKLGPHLFVVLPDKIGDEQASLDRARANRVRVQEFMVEGVNLILPIQSTNPTNYIYAYAKALEIPLNNFLGNPQIIPAIPSVFLRKDKDKIDGIIQAILKLGWKQVHLLGLGEKGTAVWAKKYPQMLFYCDSVWVRGVAKVSSGLSEYSRKRYEAVVQVDPMSLLMTDGVLDMNLIKEKLLKLAKGSKVKGANDIETILMALDYFAFHVLNYKEDNWFKMAKPIMKRDLVRNIPPTKNIWHKFAKAIGQTLVRKQGIGVSGRKTGTLSQASSYIAGKKTLLNQEMNIGKKEILFEGKMRSIGWISKNYYQVVQKENKALTKEGAINAIRGMLYTGYPMRNFLDPWIDIDKTHLAWMGVLSQTFDPPDGFNYPEFYFLFLQKHHKIEEVKKKRRTLPWTDEQYKNNKHKFKR